MGHGKVLALIPTRCMHALLTTHAQVKLVTRKFLTRSRDAVPPNYM